MKQIIVVFFLTTLFFSCENAEPLTSEEVPEIRYGTSFGECRDYCVDDLEVNAEFVYFSTYGWDDKIVATTKTLDFSVRAYNEILGMIDKEKFLALDPVIGCPDCADGGEEWIEVRIGQRTKKVTFEYQADVDGIMEAVDELRLLVEALDPY